MEFLLISVISLFYMLKVINWVWNATNLPSENVIVNRFSLHTYNSQVRSKLKSTKFKHFSSTKIIDKKPYPRRGHSKFWTAVWHWSKQSEMKYCFQVLVTCIQVLASKLSTNAKFQNLQDLNSRTFQVLSSTLSVFKHFKGPWSFYSKFKHFQAFFKHA